MLVSPNRENAHQKRSENSEIISPKQINIDTPKPYQMPKNNSTTSLDPIIIVDEESEEEVLIEDTIDKPEWTVSNVKLLLSWIEELHPLVGKCVPYRNKSDLWKEILRRFEEMGCLWTISEVIKKFSDLLREFKEATTNNNQIEADHSIFPFKSKLDRLIRNSIQHKNGISYHTYWSKAKVDLLLTSFEELQPMTADPRNNMKVRNMWKEIHRRFLERGYNVTRKQLCTKFYCLLRQYKTEISRGVQTKRTDIVPWRSKLAEILKRWPKSDQDENEEDVDDPDPIGDSSGEDIHNNNKPDNNQESSSNSPCSSDVNQNSQSSSRLTNIGLHNTRRKLSTECQKNRKIKEDYIKERQKYLKHKREYLERKEAHMIRQEQLLESILQKLDQKD